MSDPAASEGAGPGASTPDAWRRLACFLYEGVLLFGVVWGAGLVYSIVTGQRNAMTGQTGMQLLQFLVLGAYFVWFWSRRGQTLPMQTWGIRVVRLDGRPLTPLRAACRYLLAWLWFLPGLAAARLAGIHEPWPVAVIVLAGMATYATIGLLHPRKQFLHDVLCGTQLIHWKTERRRP
ncbi:RDD family protein [Piscinibacter sp.]|uniref:RDD family protein n=1 Tax=Piscinibacter sp. TaxID=1903157 RepID=UPI0039E5A6C8